MLALANSALAAPAPAEAASVSTQPRTGDVTSPDYVSVIAILLLRVIGGRLISGAAEAAIDVAKDKIAGDEPSFKDFDEVS